MKKLLSAHIEGTIDDGFAKLSSSDVNCNKDQGFETNTQEFKCGNVSADVGIEFKLLINKTCDPRSISSFSVRSQGNYFTKVKI